MTSPVIAFVAHLPILAADQANKVTDWAHPRSRDYQLVYAENATHLYVVLEEERNQKSLINLLNTNLGNWKIKRPKYSRGWLEPLTCEDYLAKVGPSETLQRVVTQVVETAANHAVEKIGAAQKICEANIAKMIFEAETSLIRGTLAAWKELAAPALLFKQKLKKDKENARRMRELKFTAERQNLQEQQKKRREQEDKVWHEQHKDFRPLRECRRDAKFMENHRARQEQIAQNERNDLLERSRLREMQKMQAEEEEKKWRESELALRNKRSRLSDALTEITLPLELEHVDSLYENSCGEGASCGSRHLP